MSQAWTTKPRRTRWPMIGCPMRPAPMIPTVRIAGFASRGARCSAEPGPLGGEDNTLLRIHMDEDGASDGSPQRRMLPREQRPCADRHSKIDRLAEKHLLLDGAGPDVLA